MSGPELCGSPKISGHFYAAGRACPAPTVQMGKLLDFTGADVLFLYSVPVLNNSDTLK